MPGATPSPNQPEPNRNSPETIRDQFLLDLYQREVRDLPTEVRQAVSGAFKKDDIDPEQSIDQLVPFYDRLLKDFIYSKTKKVVTAAFKDSNVAELIAESSNIDELSELTPYLVNYALRTYTDKGLFDNFNHFGIGIVAIKDNNSSVDFKPSSRIWYQSAEQYSQYSEDQTLIEKAIQGAKHTPVTQLLETPQQIDNFFNKTLSEELTDGMQMLLIPLKYGGDVFGYLTVTRLQESERDGVISKVRQSSLIAVAKYVSRTAVKLTRNGEDATMIGKQVELGNLDDPLDSELLKIFDSHTSNLPPAVNTHTQRELISSEELQTHSFPSPIQNCFSNLIEGFVLEKRMETMESLLTSGRLSNVLYEITATSELDRYFLECMFALDNLADNDRWATRGNSNNFAAVYRIAPNKPRSGLQLSIWDDFKYKNLDKARWEQVLGKFGQLISQQVKFFNQIRELDSEEEYTKAFGEKNAKVFDRTTTLFIPVHYGDELVAMGTLFRVGKSKYSSPSKLQEKFHWDCVALADAYANSLKAIERRLAQTTEFG